MVKYGACEVRCNNCSLSIRHTSNIWNDSGCWSTVETGQCSHWRIRIDVLTRNTFTPFGKPDQISYSVDLFCGRCSKKFQANCGATSCGTNSDTYQAECCGYSCRVGIRLTSNSVGDILSNIAMITNFLR